MTAPAGRRRLVLVRHGETTWSASGKHTSVTDLGLTARGRRQAAVLPLTLQRLGVTPTDVVTSPRTRARLTAELAGLTADRPAAVDDQLAEWAYGEYEGITSQEIHRTRPGWAVFADGAPGGETPDEVGARADAVLERYAADGDGGGGAGDVVLVSHGHFCRVLTARWIGLPVAAGSRFALDAAGVTVLGHYHDDRAVEHLNITADITAEHGLAEPTGRDELVTAVEEDVVAFSVRTRTGQAALARRFAPDLTLAAYRILVQIDGDGDSRVTDLAAEFDVGKPTMSRQVSALEELGLVRRRPDPTDGRGALVSLSAAGRTLLQRARTRRHAWIEYLLAQFDDAEAARFADLFHRFVSRPPQQQPDPDAAGPPPAS